MQNIDKTSLLEKINAYNKNTLMETLEIEFVQIGDDYLKAKMPVNPRVHQPMGLLHGGANLALAESVGSCASILFVDVTKFDIRGIEISGTHVKSKREGTVYATAKLVHKGRTLHLFEINITDENDQLISKCKLTNIILPKRNETKL